ncbi:hypothetical protein [Levilactobacillus zymae]|uniref:Aspartate aminotransferase n=1 Tax=Levilactobacillus zymae TaxID=267363 RepID=A0A1Y6K042_9LACO|nr:hypothetical protein [Levilactobacillus zymae]SMS15527.1 Aspartate aminotransferase [Levilactobacillus zymae]
MVNTILKEADLFCPNSVRINFTIYHKLNEKEVASAVRAAAAKMEALKDQATDTTTSAASGDPITPTVAATKDQAADTNAKDKAKDDLETED